MYAVLTKMRCLRPSSGLTRGFAAAAYMYGAAVQAGLSTAAAPAAPTGSKPNVVMIVIDGELLNQEHTHNRCRPAIRHQQITAVHRPLGNGFSALQRV